jgi:hypothetical protein
MKKYSILGTGSAPTPQGKIVVERSFELDPIGKTQGFKIVLRIGPS